MWKDDLEERKGSGKDGSRFERPCSVAVHDKCMLTTQCRGSMLLLCLTPTSSRCQLISRIDTTGNHCRVFGRFEDLRVQRIEK